MTLLYPVTDTILSKSQDEYDVCHWMQGYLSRGGGGGGGFSAQKTSNEQNISMLCLPMETQWICELAYRK